MTKNEAKQWLKHTRAYQYKCDNCEYIDIKGACNEECKDFYDMAIQALEEIQQYRAIGTVEEFKALKENQFFNFDSPVVRIDKKSYDKAIDDLCNEFHKDWEEQSENDMEDCIKWYDWLIASAKQLKGE